jgi:integrase
MLCPEMDASVPFWLPADDDAIAAAEGEVQEVEELQPQNVTVEKARARYLAAMRQRLGLMGAKGLKQSTYNTIVASLERAFIATIGEGEELVLPQTKFIHTINYADISAVINFHYRKGGVSERSALNYCRAFQAFLDWMDNQPGLRFHKPKGMDALFKLGKPATDPRVPSFEEVGKLFAAGRNDAERLYVLLGINCGMYEVDISNLTPASLVKHKGESCVWWRRQKTSHQNTFQTLHWLFPETLKLIEEVRAPAGNAHGRLLLNRQGEPLSEAKEGFRTKEVSRLFTGVVKRAGLKGGGVSFKSLRKFGSHEVRSQAAGDKDNIARKYLGQAIPGVLRDYVRDDFDDLTAELKRFRQRLIDEKVLPPGT